MNATRQHLAGLPPYLWVLDNVSGERDRAAVDRLCTPPGRGHPLLTTRARVWAGLGRSLDLDVLPDDAALRLLTLRRSPVGAVEQVAAVALCADVGNLPLALDVLGALLTLESSSTPYARWRERLAETMADALDLARHLAEELPTGSSRQVSAVMRASLDRVGDAGWDVLRVAARLEDAPIPKGLIAGVVGEDAWMAGIPDLGRHSLITDGGETVRVHPVVRRVVRFVDADPARAEVLDGRVVGVVRQRLGAATDAGKVPGLVADVVHGMARVGGELDVEGAGLAAHLALVAKARGDYGGARGLEQRAEAAFRQWLGPEHPDALKARLNLALTFQALGNLHAAREALAFVVKARTGTLGPKHPDTLNALQGLAGTLHAQGDLSGASDAYEFVLDAQTAQAGLEHLDTYKTRQNLAVTLCAQGDFPAASDAFECAIEAVIPRLGPEHPDTLCILQNRAVTLHAGGNLPAARALYERVFEAQNRVLEPDHPNTLTTLHNLAVTCKAQGDLPAARAAEERALEARTRVLGPEHPDTRTTRYNLLLTILHSDPAAARAHLTALQTLRTTDPARLSANDRQILADLDGLAALLATLPSGSTPPLSLSSSASMQGWTVAEQAPPARGLWARFVAWLRSG